MSVHLRLARHGSTNRPFYHIVAALRHKARDTRPLEKLGEYDPLALPTLRNAPPAWAPQMGVLTPEARIDINSLLGKMHNHRYWKIGNINRPPSPNKDPYDNEGQVIHSGVARPSDIIRQKHVEWNKERVLFWLQNGAQPTPTVAKLLIKGGLLPPGRVHRGRFRSLWGDTVHDAAALGFQKFDKENNSVLTYAPGGVLIHAREPPKAPGPKASPQEVEAYTQELDRYNSEQLQAKSITSHRNALTDEDMKYDQIPEKLRNKPGGFLTQSAESEWRPADPTALPESALEELAESVSKGLKLIEQSPALTQWAKSRETRFLRTVRRRKESKRLHRNPRLIPKADTQLEALKKTISEFRRIGRMPPAGLLVRHHQLRVARAMKYHVPYWPLVGTPHMPRI